MEKLQKYNQKLLAIIGTLLLSGVIILLVYQLSIFIINSFDDDGIDNSGYQGVNVDNTLIKGDTLAKVRTQIVSYGMPIRLNKKESKHIVEVGHVNSRRHNILGSKLGYRFKLTKKEGVHRYEYGPFNNFIYLDFEKNVSKKIFSEKVFVKRWDYLKFDSNEVLLFQGLNKDLNSDNVLNLKDRFTLYVYYIEDDFIKKYSFEDGEIELAKPMLKSNYLAVSLMHDLNNNGEMEPRYEPTSLKFINLETKEIEDIIPAEMENEMQNIIDGIDN